MSFFIKTIFFIFHRKVIYRDHVYHGEYKTYFQKISNLYRHLYFYICINIVHGNAFLSQVSQFLNFDRVAKSLNRLITRFQFKWVSMALELLETIRDSSFQWFDN